jgi:hypothetical protein
MARHGTHYGKVYVGKLGNYQNIKTHNKIEKMVQVREQPVCTHTHKNTHKRLKNIYGGGYGSG